MPIDTTLYHNNAAMYCKSAKNPNLTLAQAITLLDGAGVTLERAASDIDVLQEQEAPPPAIG